MEYIDVKNQIISKTLMSFYIFTGVERYIINAYVHKLAEVSGKLLTQKETVAECIKGGTQSLFSVASCYVVYDDSDFVSNEKAWDRIEDQLGDNMLILVLTDIDKRSKFYKHFSQTDLPFSTSIVNFGQVSDVVLEKYVQQRIRLSSENTKRLIDVCEHDVGRLLLECDKIRIFGGDDESFNKLMSDGSIYVPPTDAIFDFAESVLSCKPTNAFSLLDECLKLGEPPLRLLLVLYNNLKWLLQVQSCENTSSMEQLTGLLYWQIRTVNKYCGIYRNSELVFVLKLIHNLEKAIKRGEMEDVFAVPYVLVTLFGGY